MIYFTKVVYFSLTLNPQIYFKITAMLGMDGTMKNKKSESRDLSS
jgi:hypothetical protein